MDREKTVERTVNPLKQLQFIATTPEEANQPVINELRNGFKKLLNEFQPKHPEELMTRNEVKDFFKVDLSTIWAWTRNGRLKSYGIGNRVYYKRSEIEASIQPLN